MHQMVTIITVILYLGRAPIEAKNVRDPGDRYWELNVLSLHVSKTAKLNCNVHGNYNINFSFDH